MFPRIEDEVGQLGAPARLLVQILAMAPLAPWLQRPIAQQQRYKERTAVERVHARLKDEFGGRHVRVRGAAKVFAHLAFGLIALTVDQLVKLAT